MALWFELFVGKEQTFKPEVIYTGLWSCVFNFVNQKQTRKCVTFSSNSHETSVYSLKLGIPDSSYPGASAVWRAHSVCQQPKKKTRMREWCFFACMWDLAMPYQTQTQFIIFQTLFHTNNFAVSLMHLSVYLFSSTICLCCSLAPHMFTANAPPRWQMSSRANFIGVNKKARARWKAMERANVIWGEERVFGGRITITTASAKKRFLFCLSH